jgi:hypothetical protein
MLKESLVLFIVGTIILALNKGTKDLFGANRKKVLIYFLCSILIFALTGLLAIERLFSGSLLTNFVIMQSLMLVFGIVHLWVIGNLFEWDDERKNITQLIFTLVTVIYSLIGFINVTHYLGVSAFTYYFSSIGLTFFIGYFFRNIWERTIVFPEPVFLKWYYPLTRTVIQPEPDELRNPRIVSLLMDKTLNSAKSTIFKAKAPETMSFGKFFFLFINDYNLRTPESQISYKDANNQAYGWYFYVKPNFLGITRNINPELTVHANRIKEHSTIVCIRAKS